MIRKIVVIVVVVLGFVGLTLQMLRRSAVDCEVCMEFNGRTQCAHATGPDATAAMEEAHRSACSVLAGGVTETLECDRVPAQSASCGE